VLKIAVVVTCRDWAGPKGATAQELEARETLDKVVDELRGGTLLLQGQSVDCCCYCWGC